MAWLPPPPPRPRPLEPTIAVWQQVVSILTHLAPGDLGRLLATSTWGDLGDQGRLAVWRSYFLTHWGAEYGASRRTRVHVLSSWVGAEALPEPWPLAVGFCSALSALDHMFWFLPVLRCVLQLGRPKPRAPVRSGGAWQLACHVRHRSRQRLWSCFECNVLEVVPAGPTLQHFRQHWVMPCSRCQRFAHRACLERRLQGKESPGLRCGACRRPYEASRRFPESLPELLAATKKEWRWVGKRLLVALGFFLWISTLAGHYMAAAVSREASLQLLVTATIMSISVCPRFHKGVQMIWSTPYKWRYLRLFGAYSALCLLVVLRALQPEHWQSLAGQKPWLAGLYRVHELFHGSFAGALLLSGSSLLYLSMASGAIFLFWKTSLRVPTVASAPLGAGAQGPALLLPKLSTSGSQCGLCQLGLCLDNDCM